MNGIHDMGGMHGMGPINYELNEPVFHDEWEARVFALCYATFITYFPVDETRSAIERIGQLTYLKASYYERWFLGLELLLKEHDLLSAKQIDTQSISPRSRMRLDMLSNFIYDGVSCRSNVQAAARYRSGDRVIAKVAHPEGYTRVPRYIRGKSGVIDSDHGVYVFPDSVGQLMGESPQHVYSVRFTSRELWGEQGNEHDFLYIDLFDDHLEPAT